MKSCMINEKYTRISQIVISPCMDISLSFHFVIVRQSVNFMNKDFEFNGLIDFVSFGNGEMKFIQCLHVIILCVDYKDESSAATKNHITVKSRIKKVNLSREIPYLELNETGIADVVFDDFVCTFQEERFVWRHFMENYFLDRGFTTPEISAISYKNFFYLLQNLKFEQRNMLFVAIRNKKRLLLIF